MRRRVYLGDAALARLEAQLPVEPVGDGRPTITEFLKQDLEPALSELADVYDGLPETLLPDGDPGRLHYVPRATTVEWFHLGVVLDMRGAVVVEHIGIWLLGGSDYDA